MKKPAKPVDKNPSKQRTKDYTPKAPKGSRMRGK